MNNTLKESVYIPAWNLIKDDLRIKGINLFPGLLSILFFSVLLVYQAVYTYVEIFEKKDEVFVLILKFFESGYLIESLITGGIFLIIYMFCIPFYEGAMIQYISRRDSNEENNNIGFFSLGLYHFLPLFKFNNLFSEFKFISIINAYLFMIRFVGAEYLSALNIGFCIVFIIASIINILIAYAKYEIVLQKKDIFAAISASAKISIVNLGMTMKLYFLMFLLNIRVVFNFVIFLIFPVAIITTIGLITYQIFLTLAIIILSILFIICIVFLAYISSVLDILKTSLWYHAYKKGKNNITLIEQQTDC